MFLFQVRSVFIYRLSSLILVQLNNKIKYSKIVCRLQGYVNMSIGSGTPCPTINSKLATFIKSGKKSKWKRIQNGGEKRCRFVFNVDQTKGFVIFISSKVSGLNKYNKTFSLIGNFFFPSVFYSSE